MAVINTGLLTRGLRSEFFNRFDNAPAHYRTLATRVPSSTHTEIYRWLGTTPQMREWGQGRRAQGLRTESYSVENLKYEATLEVDRDELADDQTGQIRVRIGELADRTASHRDYLLGELLNHGHEPDFHAYDGVPFFSTNHVSGASGTQRNTLDAPATEPAIPTTTEFRAALINAITTMLDLKDDRGQPMSLSADGLYCVVPPNMYFAALEALNATLVANTSNVLAGAARLITFPWIAGSDQWYLLKNNGVVRPFIFQDREPVEFTALTDDSTEAFHREKFLFGVRARYRMAYGYWQFAVRTQFQPA